MAVALAALCAAFAPSAAFAQATAVAQGADGFPDHLSVTIPVTAAVEAHCGFTAAGAPSGSHSEPEFGDHAWSHDFPFVLDCSGPSRLAVVSMNGGLQSVATSDPGYANFAPYDVTVNVAVDSGGPITATCPAANLTLTGSCAFRGPAGVQGLSIPVSSVNQSGSYLRVSAPAYAGTDELVAGTYLDTLFITVSPAA